MFVVEGVPYLGLFNVSVHKTIISQENKIPQKKSIIGDWINLPKKSQNMTKKNNKKKNFFFFNYLTKRVYTIWHIYVTQAATHLHYHRLYGRNFFISVVMTEPSWPTFQGHHNDVGLFS